MKQERVIPARSNRSAETTDIDDIVVDDTDAELLSDIDDLLDEIDAVLEDQSMLVNFRQRSGQ
jgi:hypothetical protein